jgi:LexA DNA binding domain
VTTEAEAPMTRSTAEDGAELPDRSDPDPDHVLTWRQQEILRAITDFAERRRYAPTLREIGRAAGLSSTSGVS